MKGYFRQEGSIEKQHEGDTSPTFSINLKAEYKPINEPSTPDTNPKLPYVLSFSLWV